MTPDPTAARQFLETAADLVMVHDVMAESLSTLRGSYTRAATMAATDSPEYQWWISLAVAVDDLRNCVDVQDRASMLAALDIADAENRHMRSRTTAA